MNPAYETGRAAYVDEDLLGSVNDQDDVARVIEQMRSDLEQHPDEWENSTLDRYLEALGAVLAALPARYENRGEAMPPQPTWRMLAEVIAGATGYE